jgi:hypothetical protein
MSVAYRPATQLPQASELEGGKRATWWQSAVIYQIYPRAHSPARTATAPATCPASLHVWTGLPPMAWTTAVAIGCRRTRPANGRRQGQPAPRVAAKHPLRRKSFLGRPTTKHVDSDPGVDGGIPGP